MINPANLPNKALNHNCFLVYHETFFVVVLPKKELALYIEILMEPASPNQSASTKKITIRNKSLNISNLEISEQANPSLTNF